MMQPGRVLITGISGQDGTYLARRLSALGMTVTGTTHRKDAVSTSLVPLMEGGAVNLEYWDGLEERQFCELLKRVRPSYVFNLAALSSGSEMFDDPAFIAEINGLALARILEAIRKTDSGIRLCQASSSELFGNATVTPQSETSTMIPRSPYGAAKLFAHCMARIYREKYGLFVASAILYNHESQLRGLGFVSRKITYGTACIRLGLAAELSLGSLDSVRDWGFAGDYVEAMRLMLLADQPDDFVVATGVLHSVRQLCECAFSHVNLDYRQFVSEDHSLRRTNEQIPLVGDARKARETLGWRPTMDFAEMIRQMVDSDMALLSRK